LGNPERLCHLVSRGGDAVDEPEPGRFAGVDLPAGHEQLFGDRAGRQIRPHQLAGWRSRYAVSDVRIREKRPFSHHHDVAEGQEVGPKADGRTIHRGDDRDIQFEHALQQLSIDAGQLLTDRLVSCSQFPKQREVTAGAESPTGTSEHDSPDPLVRGDGQPALQQRTLHGEVGGIELRRPVEGHDANVASVFDQDGFFGHRVVEDTGFPPPDPGGDEVHPPALCNCRGMDTSLVPLNEPSEPFVSYCDRDEIVAFALAVNDPNALYIDGAATPPTYAVVPAFPAMMGLVQLPPKATQGAMGGVHGTHDLYIHKRIEPDMRLYSTSERCAATTSSAGMNVVIRVTSRDEAGDVVIEQYWSSLMLGEATGGSRGEEMADHTFPEDARANPVGSISLATTRDQTFRYAGASGDRSAMHVNDDVARQMGFSRKFNQGLCTLGVATGGLIQLTADGDPRRICRIAVRFTAPTFPGDDIAVSAYEIGKTDQGWLAYAFEAVSAGRTVLRHGRLEVRPSTP
jgi:acyl dehydratase